MSEYRRTGEEMAPVVGILAFLASWAYCTFSYGFLFGFGVGVIPSLLIGILTCMATVYLWGPILGAAAMFLLYFAWRQISLLLIILISYYSVVLVIRFIRRRISRI